MDGWKKGDGWMNGGVDGWMDGWMCRGFRMSVKY